MNKSTSSPFAARHQLLNWGASMRRLRTSGLMLGVAALAGSSLLFAGSLQAANDAWSTTPVDNTFTGNNWTLGTTTPAAPTGTIASGDAAYFGTSSITALNDNEAAGFTIAGMTFNAGASAYTITGNSINLTAAIFNNSSVLQTINDNMTATGGGFATTSAGLTLGGNITETQSGGFTLAGSANGSAGTVTLGGTDSFASTGGSLSVGGGATLVINGTTTLSEGNSQYVQIGAGGGSPGTLTVNAGATLNAVATAGSSANFFLGTFASGTLNLNGTANFAASEPLRLGYNSGQAGSVTTVNLNAGGLLVTASSLTVGSANAALTVAFNFNGGTLRANAAGLTLLQPNATSTTTVTTTSTASAIDSNGYAATVSAPIGGTGGLTVIDSSSTGGGVLTLSANSTYTGATTINSGTLTLTGGGNSGGALAGTPSITVNNGGKLVLTNGDTLGYTANKEALIINSGGQVLNNAATARDTIQNTVTMTGGILGGTGAGDANGLYSFNTTAAVNATSDASGTAALINAAKISFQAGTATFNVTRGAATPASDLTVSSQIIPYGGGTAGLTKAGNGILTLSGANTYTGATSVNGGTLQLTGSLSASSALAVGGGTFNYAPATAASTQTVNGTAINSGNSIITATTGNTLNLGAVTHTAGGLVSFGGAGTITTSGTGANGILGPYAYIGTGTGLSYVTPASTAGTPSAIAAYTGGTTTTDATGVTDTTGTVNYNVPAGGAVGTGASANTLRYTGTAASTITGNITLNGLMNAGTSALTLSNTLQIGSTNDLDIISNGQNITLNGVVNGGTTQSLTYGGPGAGTLTVTANNTYSGGTTINGGTLQDNYGGGAGYAALRGNVTVNTGGTLALNAGDALGYNAITAGNSVALLNINGGTVNIMVAGNQGYTAGLTMTGGTFSSTGGGAFNISPGQANAPKITTNAASTTALISAPITIRDSGNLPINVAAGTAGTTLGSDLTISGVINNSQGGNGALTKNGAGSLTLTGTNTYSGGTTITAGTLLTGGTGTLGAGNVAITGGALTLGSSVSFADTAKLSFTGSSVITLNNTTADVLSNIVDTDTGAVTPQFTAGTAYSASQLDTLFGVSSFVGNGSLIVAVPEPATWLGGLLLVGTFGFTLRRRAGARVG